MGIRPYAHCQPPALLGATLLVLGIETAHASNTIEALLQAARDKSLTRSMYTTARDSIDVRSKFWGKSLGLLAAVALYNTIGLIAILHSPKLDPYIQNAIAEDFYHVVNSGKEVALLFAILAVFVAGLMVGRTPEYVGKKIEAREVKLAVLAIAVLPLMILGLTALSSVLQQGLAGPLNKGPHGFSEILYAFTSAVANNGSAFAGLTASTPYYDGLLGVAMWVGRFFVIVPMLAIAGSLAAKKYTPEGAGSFPTTGGLWVGLLIGIILILGGLTFLPSLALGPIADHLAMIRGQLF